MPSDQVSAVHGRETVDLAMRLEPDVVIMDTVMPLIDGNTATRRIQEHSSKTRVIVLPTYNEPGVIEKMYQAGAEGYVLKTASSEDLLAAIRGKGTSAYPKPGQRGLPVLDRSYQLQSTSLRAKLRAKHVHMTFI